MKAYTGILNNNGVKHKVRIYLDLIDNYYSTAFYINQKLLPAKIECNRCTIYEENDKCCGFLSAIKLIFGLDNSVTFDLSMQYCGDEIIVVGIDARHRQFFVVSNKEEV